MVLSKTAQATVAGIRDRYDHSVLALQGGGALGAYQAGVYDGLAECGIELDWITGVSIGAINAALIAGNAPSARVDRLAEFWDMVSSSSPLIPLASFDMFRPSMNRLSANAAAAFGVPGFFAPRMPPPYFASDGSIDALSIYDTAPLKNTLESFIDFDLINSKRVRLSVGAVNVRTGNSIYFDNRDIRIEPEHIMASGALPPGFPPLLIDGEPYWDGGLVSNTPLFYVLDDTPLHSALIMQVDLFSAVGDMPRNLDQVLERAKDIQYSSKTRFNTNQAKQIDDLKLTLRRVLDKLPKALQKDADVKLLKDACDGGHITIAHLINRRNPYASQSKDYEFSRATIRELWESGRDDVRRTVTHPEMLRATEAGEGMRVYDLAR
jgi:NTE family protein